MEKAEEIDIAIVGGGICGLATALALHRKGIRSVVLERSETLRVTRGAIGVMTNGWRALDQLGVGSKLRETALPMHGVKDIWLDNGKRQESQLSLGEARAVKRSELIKALADNLPPQTIRFGCQILSVKLGNATSSPILYLQNGTTITAKALIGCDGASSVVAEFLQLKTKKAFASCAVRGFTNYPNGHGLSHKFFRVRKGRTLSGRAPVDDKLVFWFVAHQWSPEDLMGAKDPEHVRQITLNATMGFPEEVTEMIRCSDLNSFVLTHLWYRTPWEVLLRNFRKGTVTVAGDAMHLMGPFLGQGGSAAMEDAVVFARCLAKKVGQLDWKETEWRILKKKIEVGIDQYIGERRMRLVRLSMQTYLTGSMLETSSILVKFLIIVIFMVLFRNQIGHTQYDCGRL